MGNLGFHGFPGQITQLPKNNTMCRYYLSADQASIPADTAARIELDTKLYDLGGNFTLADWYGSSGAYTQADGSGCGATTIVKTGAGFQSGMIGSLVRSASDAAGTLNTGTHYITARPDTNTLTIVKATGTNFANSYYFWIKKNFYVVPSNGLYLIVSNCRIDPTVDQKRYNLSPYNCNVYSVSLGQDTRHASGTIPLVPTHVCMAYLLAGDLIGLIISGTSITGTMTIKGSADPAYASYTSLSIVRIA